MRVVLDTCVWGGATLFLRQEGHDVVWTGDWEKDPGDESILEFAHRENRVCITLDKDFGQLAVLQNKPHAGIIRLVGISAREQGPVAHRILQKYEPQISKSAIITVDPKRTRIRSS